MRRVWEVMEVMVVLVEPLEGNEQQPNSRMVGYKSSEMQFQKQKNGH